jgi:DMSO/TMAO reductase YedYZ molybdopterin-dependent catalytic subunit
MTHLTERVGDRLARSAAAVQGGLSSPVRNSRMAVVTGRMLGLAFLVCFATGLFSHYLQQPLPWMRFPTRPVSLYAWTQGIHITVGIAIFPLLFGKLWTVYPRLFTWPPFSSFRELLERVSIAVLVASALLEPALGLVNTYQWYPWPFSFRRAHFGLAWVIVGALAVHIAVKLPIIIRYWRGSANRRSADQQRSVRTPDATRSRRAFLIGIGASAAALVTLTAGQSFAPFAPTNLFAPRVKGSGPQSVPVNHTAKQAAVIESATDPRWALTVSAGSLSRTLSRAQLAALPQTEAELPIACVEGWSTTARWRGVRVKDLMALVDAPQGSALRVTSLQPHGNYRVMTMTAEFVQDPTTLIALELNGETLDLDHGFPARIIAPGRPGVLQTKWLKSIEVVQ